MHLVLTLSDGFEDSFVPVRDWDFLKDAVVDPAQDKVFATLTNVGRVLQQELLIIFRWTRTVIAAVLHLEAEKIVEEEVKRLDKVTIIVYPVKNRYSCHSLFDLDYILWILDKLAYLKERDLSSLTAIYGATRDFDHMVLHPVLVR